MKPINQERLTERMWFHEAFYTLKYTDSKLDQGAATDTYFLPDAGCHLILPKPLP